MPVVALTWPQAGALALGLYIVAYLLRRSSSAPFVREAGTIAALYALWQLAGTVSLADPDGALRRARWIERTERTWHLPSEASVQRLILPHPLISQLANLYYATMHFGMLFAFLLWLFVRHRDRYPPVRTTLALLTLACLVIQLEPVAPPRLLPGYVDVAARYGQSVYTNLGFGADQLSAMPSVHVGWAVLIGVSVVQISPSRWRWAILAHPAITIAVVVATGNHWWADGIVAVVLLALADLLRRRVRTLRRAWRRLAAVAVRAPARRSG